MKHCTVLNYIILCYIILYYIILYYIILYYIISYPIRRPLGGVLDNVGRFTTTFKLWGGQAGAGRRGGTLSHLAYWNLLRRMLAAAA